MVFFVEKLLARNKTSTWFVHPALLEKYDKSERNVLSKVCNVNFDDISSIQLALVWDFIRIIISTSLLFGLSF